MTDERWVGLLQRFRLADPGYKWSYCRKRYLPHHTFFLFTPLEKHHLISIMDNQMKPESRQPLDMAFERQRSSLSPDSLSCLFSGSKQARDNQRFLFSLIKSDPTLNSSISTSSPSPSPFSKDLLPFQSRMERFQSGQKTSVAYLELRNQQGLSKPDRDKLRLFTDVYLSVQVHESMGHPTLMNQSDENQWNQWKDNVINGKWIVSYAQTEIAHGSNLSGLRTTATLAKDGQSWIINTPEMSAGKAWIGGSGLSATVSAVYPFLWLHKSRKNYRSRNWIC